MEQFPDDWIAPFEFSFCHHCGNYLVAEDLDLKDNPICNNCKSGKADHETEIIHKKLSEKRLKIADERRQSGIPPVWWKIFRNSYEFAPNGKVIKKGRLP